MYKTKLPFNFYLAITSALMILIILVPDGIVKACFYSVLVFFFIYIVFSRDACIVKLTTEFLRIKYVYPWEKGINIPIKSIKQIEYEKGFYDLVSDKQRSFYNFPKYCSDLLIITQHDKEQPDIQIEINTRFRQFDVMFEKLKKLIAP